MKSIISRFTPFIILFLLSILAQVNVNGQGLQDSLRNDEQDIVSSIAPYAADVREAILNVSQYPQYLVKIERVQARTSQSFQDRLSAYPRNEQEKLYDLSRYPELVSKLATGSQKTPSEVKFILADYPEEVAASVNELYPDHLADLQFMDLSYRQSQEVLQSIVQPLPHQVQEDFKVVIGMPAVMSLLTDRIDLTVSLGEAYKNNPEEVTQSLSTLHDQITAQSEKDLADYKMKAEQDPELQAEMKKSSQEFADSYSGSGQNQNPVVVNNNYYSANPYPYWFGYPYWYPTPMWYPGPLYYQTGFYVGAAGNIVVVGLPSYTYSNWFFHYGYRRYPRIYGWYSGYYNLHRSYRPNANVYRGYNSAAWEHFNHVQRDNDGRSRVPGATRPSQGPTSQSGGNYSTPNRSRETNAPRTYQQGPDNRGSRSQDAPNGISHRNNTFDPQQFRHYQSQQFHQQGWRNVGGSRMERSGFSPQRGGNMSTPRGGSSPRKR